jgi:RHS repeat-associated protein
MRLTGNARYYHHDQIGSTRALSDQDGHRIALSDYDAYGNPVTKIDTKLNPFGFAGQYTDANSGLIYMRARWYDPRTAQFLTRDPLGLAAGDQHLYGYAARDPLGVTDPTGMIPARDFWLTVDGIMGLGSGVAFTGFGLWFGYAGFTTLGGAMGAVAAAEGFSLAGLAAFAAWQAEEQLRQVLLGRPRRASRAKTCPSASGA